MRGSTVVVLSMFWVQEKSPEEGRRGKAEDTLPESPIASETAR